MGIEIERKFLVLGDDWRVLGQSTRYRQGYLSSQADRTVRVRLAGDKGYLTIKGQAVGLSRPEYEYEIPRIDAEELLDRLCDRPLIEKIRYRIPQDKLVWEVDEFFGENQGLIMAEIELPDPDFPVQLPPWIGQEVTGDPRYFNSNLAKHPFQQWES